MRTAWKVLDYAARRDHPEAASAAAAVRRAVLGTAADGIRTVDLGGDATTSRMAAEIIARVRAERRASLA